MVDELPLPLDEDAGAPPALRRRPWLRTLLLWVVPALVLALAFAWFASGGRYVSTDNAYVQQDRVDVAPQLTANVRAVLAGENQPVTAGMRILVLDDAEQRVALRHAQAALASAHAEVEGLRASWREKLAELQVARRTAAYLVRDYRRQQELAGRHLVAEITVDNAHRDADSARGNAEVLELQLAEARARLAGDPDMPADQHPAVLAAVAVVERARLDLAHTVIVAPQAGVISHLPKVGDRLIAGEACFAIVVDQQPWVEANFKETDLARVRAGQSVSVRIDTYGGRRWQGRVESIAQATGAEFALLPPQNASGNWVKVVQRIPVRILLDTRPGDPPLRAGMSADVEIDTGAHTRLAAWLGRSG
ncbi:Multidrug export protein EmrA [Gammaproteobacteria bacterium]|nr:Multidrug export protein EmrA [Gammaproteobacteria bacterium]